MKQFYIALFFLGTSLQIFAQYNVGTTYGNHNDLNASKYQPSELDLGDKRFQIGFNYYLWMGNTTFNYSNIKKAYDQGNIDFLNPNVKETNVLGAGQDYQILGIAYQHQVEEDRNYVFGLSVVDKVAMNFSYRDNFIKMALKGNKQFAGQKTNLGATTVNANYTREYVLSAALPLFGNNEKGLRLGLRGKLVQGLAAIYMPKGKASIYTEQNGRYIDMDFDYAIYTAGLKNFSFTNANGLGLGLDAGLSYYLSEKFEVSASVLDLGYVDYKKNTRSYTKTGSGRYEGLVIDNLFGGSRQNLDSANAIIDADQTSGNSFRMPLGSRICLEMEYKTPKKDKGDRGYKSNSIFLTYIQGLNNYPGAITRPFLSLAYNHDFHKFFDGGVMVAAGGYNKVAAGLFFSLNFNHFIKLGMSSDNLMAFIIPRYGTGIDVAANFSLSF